MMTFIEHPAFTRLIQDLNAEDALHALQIRLASDPDAGDVIPGMGGLRKVRLALPGRGKRGGARVLYLLFVRAETVYFVYGYAKGEFSDLSPEKRRTVRLLVDGISREFKS
jgi:hypothetical protein